VFDDVNKADPYNTGFKLDSSELPSNDDTDYETAISAIVRASVAAISQVPLIDPAQDMRPRC
jgi:hypothetical protein